METIDLQWFTPGISKNLTGLELRGAESGLHHRPERSAGRHRLCRLFRRLRRPVVVSGRHRRVAESQRRRLQERRKRDAGDRREVGQFGPGLFGQFLPAASGHPGDDRQEPPDPLDL